jgi:hypothetical protein
MERSGPIVSDESLHVAVVDIGKLQNLGWAIEGPAINQSGTDIELCIKALASAMDAGPLALGFEAPMFVPFGRKRCDLDNARIGEGDHAFGAAPGACVLTKSLVIVPYILRGLRSRAAVARPTFKWRDRLSRGDLLLFEAFVTNAGKSNHQDCARFAVMGFREKRAKGGSIDSDLNEPCTMNLLGAMILRMGWSEDLKMLSEPCLVVRCRGANIELAKG